MADGQKVAVVTGASSGIGLVTARALAAQGMRVIGVGRNPDRCAAAEAELRKSGDVEMLRADLSLMAEVERLAAEIVGRTDRIDVLVNNAGAMAGEMMMTGEGLEANFAANHVGPFLLTQRLMPLLLKAAEGAPAGSVRILMTASDASEMGPPLNFDDMQSLGNFNPGLAYCLGKLANVMFARALSVRLAGTGIVAHSMAPGATDTPFFDNGTAESRERTRGIPKLTVEQGADTLIWLATAEEPGQSSGGYWERRAPRKPNPQVEDGEALVRFWDASEKLVAGALG